MRAVDQERILWVDAICINHAGKIEKSYKVDLTTHIYKTIWRGIAWLGELEEDAVLPHGPSSYASPDHGVTMNKADAQRAFESMKWLSKFSPDGHFAVQEDNVPPGWVKFTYSDVISLNRLVSLRCWSRVWTAQESVLPPRIALVLGNILCEEPLVLLAAMRNWDLTSGNTIRCTDGVVRPSTHKDPNYQLGSFTSYEHIQSLRETKLPMPLGEAINRFRIPHCTDPRDKAFGLLGLAHPKTTLGNTVDRRHT